MFKLAGDFIVFCLVRLLVSVGSVIPLSRIYTLERPLKFIVKDIWRYRRHIIERQLRQAFPEKDLPQLSQLIDQYYSFLTRVIMEGIKGFTMSPKEMAERFKCINMDILKSSLAKGDVLVLTAHTGNWEWLPVVNQYLSTEIIGAYRSLSNPYLDKYFKRKRARYGYELFPAEYIYRRMKSKTERGRVFMAIADQRPAGHQQSISVSFLGEETLFTSGYAQMACRLDMPVAYGELRQTEKGNYHLEILWIENNIEDPNLLTERYALSLEQTILSNPSNWLWSHDRWKKSS